MITSGGSLGYEVAVYSQLKDNCQRFLILSSVTQRHGTAPDSTIFDSGLRASLSRQLCQTMRLAVPAQDYSQIIIDEKKYSGLVDNQASANVMSLGFVRKHGFEIVPERVLFELANGSVQYSIGYALVNCALTRDQQRARVHRFHIFTTCVEPLVLGRRLLYDMGILSSPQVSELQSFESDKPGSSRFSENPLGGTRNLRPAVRICLRTSTSTKEILAVPDKGSDVDAMSLAFAQSMGYNIDSKETSQSTFRLASGLMIRSAGTVCASFEMKMDNAKLDLLQRTFVVILNFPFDIAFGNAFIHELKVFEANLSCLEWVHVRERLPLLCPLFKNRQGQAVQRVDSDDSGLDMYTASARRMDEEKAEEEKAEAERSRQQEERRREKDDEKKRKKYWEEAKKKNERRERRKERKERWWWIIVHHSLRL